MSACLAHNAEVKFNDRPQCVSSSTKKRRFGCSANVRFFLLGKDKIGWQSRIDQCARALLVLHLVGECVSREQKPQWPGKIDLNMLEIDCCVRCASH